MLVWCDDPPEDPVISIFPGCLPNHDHAHSPVPLVMDLRIGQNDSEVDLNLVLMDTYITLIM
jgi:hypothetical protein